ncbi:MAG TPA: winged helix-turn-helix domain-containing protein [Anaerolineae bacterium]|nr:winged helix-turn-helix domain-containing protein [Anaerolineae bacterium]
MSTSNHSRQDDVEFILRTTAEGYSVSIVGLSNVGKSTLLRAVCSTETQAQLLGSRAATFTFIYVDCNLMLTLTPQGFYEVTLRAAQAALQGVEAPHGLGLRLNEFYQKVVEPPSEFAVPLAFNDALDTLSAGLERSIVILFDEFDEPFARLDSRVFLNLRALSDKFGKRLSYVVATTTPLSARNTDSDVSEFVELFVGRQRTLHMLNDAEARALAVKWAQAEGATLDPHELDFIVEQAGGHASLGQAVTRVVLQVAAGVPADALSQALALARERLEDDAGARAECSKLWSQLSDGEREALTDLTLEAAAAIEPARRAALLEKGLIVGNPPRLFSSLFAGFARRQRHARQSARAGVWVDVDAGEVTVDGQPVPTLTDLEYRLLLLLWGRLNKMCDKYQIVESVWGQDYIDEVDDARIEKLISRLRAKLEQDPANPRYLLTVRGRGYKLVGI